MRLDELTAALGAGARLGAREAGGPVEITGLAYDSRSVRPGDLFVALPGVHADGHRFIAAAIARGAAAVLSHGTTLAWPQSQKIVAPMDVSGRPCVLPHFLQVNQIMR